MDSKESQFEILYNKVVEDQEFRTRLAQNPESALKEVGIEPTREIITQIHRIKAEVEYLDEVIGGGPHRMAT